MTPLSKVFAARTGLAFVLRVSVESTSDMVSESESMDVGGMMLLLDSSDVSSCELDLSPSKPESEMSTVGDIGRVGMVWPCCGITVNKKGREVSSHSCILFLFVVCAQSTCGSGNANEF